MIYIESLKDIRRSRVWRFTPRQVHWAPESCRTVVDDAATIVKEKNERKRPVNQNMAWLFLCFLSCYEHARWSRTQPRCQAACHGTARLNCRGIPPAPPWSPPATPPLCHRRSRGSLPHIALVQSIETIWGVARSDRSRRFHLVENTRGRNQRDVNHTRSSTQRMP